MAETATLSAEQSYERDTLPGSDYRAALVDLLGVHSLPVWGWGQRDAYTELVMAGPGLDHWVRTSNLWAEEERDLWEWEQLVGSVTDEPVDALVRRSLGDLADTVPGAIAAWLDLTFVAAYVDALGEELVHTVAHSTYAPLARHARVMTLYKRGQAADGCTALADVVRNNELPADDVAAAAARWASITEALAQRAVAVEQASRWTDLGLAAPFDSAAALERIETRVHNHLEDRT